MVSSLQQVVKPKPLSSVINPAKTSKVISHALLVNAVLDRIAEAHVKLRQDETPTKAWYVSGLVELYGELCSGIFHQ